MKVLTFISFYLPGFKAGGPVKTVANMVDHLSDDFEFWIVTSDRDFGDLFAYEGTPVEQWTPVGKAMVYYCPPERKTLMNLARLINRTPYDVLYLNSFFDPIFTVKPLLVRYFRKRPHRPVVLAVRGEFSKGALSLKRLKKKAYILLARLLGLYKGVMFQASSAYESQDIKSALQVPYEDVLIALDLPEKASAKTVVVNEVEPLKKGGGALRVVFLSRISPMKNLDYALSVLKNVTLPIELDIFGPKEDEGYWLKCLSMMAALPSNVRARYCGSVHPSDVVNVISEYDLFFLPSRGENYGHVIVEALSSGVPVLTSDQTPWRDLCSDNLGWDLPLNDKGRFVEVIEFFCRMDLCARAEWRKGLANRAQLRVNNPEDIEANRDLFFSAIKKTIL